MGFTLRPLVYEVTYLDGTVEEITATMRARVEVERTWPEGATTDADGKVHLQPPAPALDATFLVAWWSKQDPALVEKMSKQDRQSALNEWLSTVMAISEPNREPADPSQPAATDD